MFHTYSNSTLILYLSSPNWTGSIFHPTFFPSQTYTDLHSKICTQSDLVRQADSKSMFSSTFLTQFLYIEDHVPANVLPWEVHLHCTAAKEWKERQSGKMGKSEWGGESKSESELEGGLHGCQPVLFVLRLWETLHTAAKA